MYSNENFLSRNFDKSVCIICLEKSSLTSKYHGFKRIRTSADFRKDIVFERLKQFNASELFWYHMTDQCYRKYCNIKRKKNPLLCSFL